MKNIERQKIFSITTNIIIWMVVIVLLVISSTLLLTKFDNPYGIKLFSVTSGSMEPSIGLGSLVLTKANDQYYENDVITFSKRGNINDTTTHRIVNVIVDADLEIREYVTKGDANEDADQGDVRNNNVIGKVVVTIPLLGYVTEFAKTQLGFILMIIIPATVLVMHEFMNIKNEIIKIYSERKSRNYKKKTRKISNDKE